VEECSGKSNDDAPVVDSGLLQKALRALIKHVTRNEAARAQDLLSGAGSQTVILSFNLACIPESLNCRPVQMEIPHPLYDSSEVCLIVKPPQRLWKDKLAADPIKNLTKIIDVDKLRKKYSSVKDRSQLCSAFDLFLCDYRIIERMPQLLGKAFISAKKLPIAVRLRQEEDLKAPIEKALRCTYMTIRRGQNVAVKIGRINFGDEKLTQNAAEVISKVTKFFQANPKWKNIIMSINVRATDTVSLPLYVRPEVMKRPMQEPDAKSKPPAVVEKRQRKV